MKGRDMVESSGTSDGLLSPLRSMLCIFIDQSTDLE
jgi:hypothetical protein